jgi:antitoxin component of RelBE/YafQ-DinJ toxin-antitoxin module
LPSRAQDVVKTAKFVETSVLPVLKSAQANQSTIETVTSLVSPQAANIERAGFAVLGVIINAIDAAGAAAGANGLNVTLDAQLVADVKAIAAAVKRAMGPAVAAAPAK